ncbi:hypothetical protein LOK49_LG04G01247 [Camellia lanceoleosa]|uniref:Uncharacterized protein n=1 Tax=Camellia lanceoleosa TaxID=1840588 RepID=A0ACC0I4E5_9ERIC|nr:hypothetical protein LOK49_LG04G01247 [Camellia lanceoleosa]
MVRVSGGSRGSRGGGGGFGGLRSLFSRRGTGSVREHSVGGDNGSKTTGGEGHGSGTHYKPSDAEIYAALKSISNVSTNPHLVLIYNPSDEEINAAFESISNEEDTTALWVRFPNLPIEYYNEKVLFHIAKVLGVPLKIDINTAMASRGKYARVCIETDLRKPLVSQFAIGKNIYLVEYEHLYSVYFSCGRVGHVNEVCNDKLVLEGIKQRQQLTEGENQMEEPAGAKGLGSSRVKDVGETSQVRYGPWMKVTNQRKTNKGLRLQKGPTHQQGNRFRSLQEEEGQGAQKAQPRKDKEPMQLVSQELGFKYKVKTKGVDVSREGGGNQLEIAQGKHRDETRREKGKGVKEASTHSLEAEQSNKADTLMLTSSHCPTTTNPSHSHPNNPSHIHHTNPSHTTHVISSITPLIRERKSRPKFREPPEKNGGRRGRELSNGASQGELTQSSADTNPRERSVSPHHLRMVDGGSKHEDPTMEIDRSTSRETLCLSNSLIVNGS